MPNSFLDRLHYIFGLRGVVIEDVADLQVEGPVGTDERFTGRAIDMDRLRHHGEPLVGVDGDGKEQRAETLAG